MPKTKTDWEKELSPKSYAVTYEGSTETPFTGKFLYNKAPGMYHYIHCNNPLFPSSTKFDSGTGWPSFWDVAKKNKIVKFTSDTVLIA